MSSQLTAREFLTLLPEQFSAGYPLAQPLRADQGRPLVVAVVMPTEGCDLADYACQQAAVDTAWLSYSPPITA
jgi:hypothetical protein